LAVTDWRLWRWRLWFLVVMTATRFFSLPLGFRKPVAGRSFPITAEVKGRLGFSCASLLCLSALLSEKKHKIQSLVFIAFSFCVCRFVTCAF